MKLYDEWYEVAPTEYLSFATGKMVLEYNVYLCKSLLFLSAREKLNIYSLVTRELAEKYVEEHKNRRISCTIT